MSNPYIISIKKNEGPEPFIVNNSIDMLLTIHGFDKNYDMTEFDFNTHTKPYSLNNNQLLEKNFSRRKLTDTILQFVYSFSLLPHLYNADRLKGEPSSSLASDEWMIVVTAPDGTEREFFQGPIYSHNNPLMGKKLSDFPQVFVTGCKVDAYTPLFVKYRFKMTEMGREFEVLEERESAGGSQP